MLTDKPFVLILGMHRSGTSCLAGSLERCGLYLGPVLRHGVYNSKGYYEIRRVQTLHDQILGLGGGSWHHPPAQIAVHPSLRQQLQIIADQLSARRPCGLKDPRALLLLDLWSELVGRPRALVGTFRHPMAVAHSLASRNGLSIEHGIALWVHYNSILISRHQSNPFPIVEFDLSDVDSYCRTVAGLAVELGLVPSVAQLHRFVSATLDHNPAAGGPVPRECREAYEYLSACRWEPRPVSSHVQTGNLSTTTWAGMLEEALFLAVRWRPTRFLNTLRQPFGGRRRPTGKDSPDGGSL